jgi:membrane-associated phospholipid phosphatase
MLKKNSLINILLLAGCFCFCKISVAQNWEVNLLEKINSPNHSSTYFKTASQSVYPIAVAHPLALLSVGYINKNKKMQQQGWQTIGALAINTAITQGLKYTINRERPYEKYPTIIFPYEIENDASFPSGHTSTAFATATTLSLQFKKWYIVVPAYTWAASVGYSRMYLGEHYPTDVLAGAIIGTGSAILSNWLTKKYFTKRNK